MGSYLYYKITASTIDDIVNLSKKTKCIESLDDMIAHIKEVFFEITETHPNNILITCNGLQIYKLTIHEE